MSKPLNEKILTIFFVFIGVIIGIFFILFTVFGGFELLFKDIPDDYIVGFFVFLFFLVPSSILAYIIVKYKIHL